MTRLVVKDTGVRDALAGLRLVITGGVHADDGAAVHDKGPLSVVDVAAQNEFGAGNIPARMWLRGWVPGRAEKVVAQIRAAVVDAVRRQRFEQGPFETIVEGLMQSLRGRITSGEIRPVNAPRTLANKAPETRPLFEHGQLVAAIKGRLQAANTAGRAGRGAAAINWRAEKG